MGRVRAVVGAGFVLGALALALALSRSPPTVAAANMSGYLPILSTSHRLSACQSGETLPRGVTTVRLEIFASIGPRLTVSLLDHGRLLASGERGPGWTGGSVTVPLKPHPVSSSAATLCFTLALHETETVELQGEKTAPRAAARGPGGPLPGRVRADYLRPGHASWLSLGSGVAWRMGLGHSPGGPLSVILIVAAMAGVVALCTRILSRGLR